MPRTLLRDDSSNIAEGTIELSEDEFADFQRVCREYDSWQERIQFEQVLTDGMESALYYHALRGGFG